MTLDVVRNEEQAGESLIAGDGLRDGYVKNQQETERRYLPDRYGQSAVMVSILRMIVKIVRIFSVDSIPFSLNGGQRDVNHLPSPLVETSTCQASSSGRS